MNSETSLKRVRVLTGAAIAGALAVIATTAAAQNLPKEGAFAYTACFNGASKVIALSKSHLGYSFEITGENVADKPGTLLDHASFRCEGVGTKIGKDSTRDVVCLFVDRDGDKDLVRISNHNGKLHRVDVAGTGKFDGMVIHTSLKPIGKFPGVAPHSIQGCNHVVGSYKLK